MPLNAYKQFIQSREHSSPCWWFLYWTLTYFDGGITSLECLNIQEESIARVLGSAEALTLLLPLLDSLSLGLVLKLFLLQLPHALHLPWTQTLHVVLVSMHGWLGYRHWYILEIFPWHLLQFCNTKHYLNFSISTSNVYCTGNGISRIRVTVLYTNLAEYWIFSCS